MTVKLTQPILGKNVGDSYTGPLEAWILAEGYGAITTSVPDAWGLDDDGIRGAKAPVVNSGDIPQAAKNTGAQATTPANDPTLKANREPGYWPLSEDHNVTIANDGTNLTKTSFPAPSDFDFDASGTDDEKPSLVVLKPKSGKAAGGTVVTISGDNLEGVTGVTFDGVAGTSLDVSTAGDGVIKVTAPAHAAGAVDVVVTDNIGATTLTGGFTYKA